jgi:hypothetical protein
MLVKFYNDVLIEKPIDLTLGTDENSIPCMLPIPFTPSGFNPLGILV